MNVQGGVDTFINNRGTGYGLAPDWQNAGHTHAGMGVDGAQADIRFGRLFGSGRMDVSEPPVEMSSTNLMFAWLVHLLTTLSWKPGPLLYLHGRLAE